MLAIKIWKEELSFNVFFMYNPPYNIIKLDSLSKLFDKLAKIKNCIIMGDLNGQHKQWGSTITNQQGRYLLDSIDLFSNLTILNDNSPTRITFKNSGPDIASS